MSHIVAEELSKTYRVPVREGGLRSAFASLLHTRYNEVKAVDGVSFSIDRGEIVGFIGPNGAGKTTTLKMLSGLLYPTSGSATAAGFIPWQRRTQYLKKISMLMGNRSQMQWNNTVYDTMTVFRDIYGIPHDEFRDHLSDLAAMFDVEKLMSKRARNLSLGERSKCELILALLHKPEILYLDEPTLGMDVTMQLRLRQYVREYNRKFGATIILTSHYMSDIVSLCPRVLMINGGKLIYNGALSGLADRLAAHRMIKLAMANDETVTQHCLDAIGIPAELMEQNGNECTLRVKKEDLVKAGGMLMGKFNLKDFSVSEPAIESVIDQVYEKGMEL